ncbi:MAG: hypothetical protein WCO63_15205 [Bacteroidota bacterium]
MDIQNMNVISISNQRQQAKAENHEQKRSTNSRQQEYNTNKYNKTTNYLTITTIQLFVFVLVSVGGISAISRQKNDKIREKADNAIYCLFKKFF